MKGAGQVSFLIFNILCGICSQVFSVHKSSWSDIRKLIKMPSSAGAVYGTYDAIRSKVKFILASSFAKA